MPTKPKIKNIDQILKEVRKSRIKDNIIKANKRALEKLLEINTNKENNKMKLKDVLNIIIDSNQDIIIAKKSETTGIVHSIANKDKYRDTTTNYLECEVDRMHSTSSGDIVIRIK